MKRLFFSDQRNLRSSKTPNPKPKTPARQRGSGKERRSSSYFEVFSFQVFSFSFFFPSRNAKHERVSRDSGGTPGHEHTHVPLASVGVGPHCHLSLHDLEELDSCNGFGITGKLENPLLWRLLHKTFFSFLPSLFPFSCLKIKENADPLTFRSAGKPTTQVVVVLSGSMEPAFQRGDILFLHNGEKEVESGDIVVFNLDGRDIPIVHRVLRTHERREDGELDILTKGDNNYKDDRVLYDPGQEWIHKGNLLGRAVGYLPYAGMATIIMNDYPIVKYCLIGFLALLVVTSKD